MKSLVVFCEGPHDVGFMCKLLKLLDFRDFSGVIESLPRPLNKIVAQAIKDHDLSEINLQNYKPPIPKVILQDTENLIILYETCGDTQYSRVNDLINLYKDALEYESSIDINELAFVFITDSDNKGLERTVEILKKEYSNSLKFIDNMSHGNCFRDDNISVGCYVFEDGSGFGKLENIVIPLMKKDNDSLFNDIDMFIQRCDSYIPGRIKRNHLLKMKVGLVGQLTNPGSTNYVIIKQSELLNNEKLIADHKAMEIIEFFRQFIK